MHRVSPRRETTGRRWAEYVFTGDGEDITRIGKQGRNRLTRALSDHCVTNEIKTVTALLAAGFDGGEDALDRLTAERQKPSAG